jgi:UDP-GlcNAc:undecaprenyl-phosphate GlcNAc-1-phosphate transferase
MAGLGLGVGFVVTLLVGWVMIRLGPRLGIIDVPDNGLKPHTGSPVPLGGVAVLAGSLAGLAVAGEFDIAIFAAMVMVWVVGLADDISGVSPVLRLLGSVVAGLLLVFLSDTSFEVTVGVFWVVAVVVVVHAINLFDGLDLLAGTVMTVAVLGITWFAGAQGVSEPLMVLVISGPILGFLVWNRPPARLYLGDNGAYLLGVLAVWAAMSASADRMGGVVAVALVGVPLIDLGVTIFRRGLAGSPIFSGDRDHTYDRLHQQGLSSAGVALLFTVAQAVWVVVVVMVSIVWGDITAAITALALGLLIAGFLGVRQLLSDR